MSLILHKDWGLVDRQALEDHDAIKAQFERDDTLNGAYIEIAGFQTKHRHKAGGRALIQSLRVEYTALVCRVLKI